MIIFTRKTHGCWVPPFLEPLIYIYTHTHTYCLSVKHDPYKIYFQYGAFFGVSLVDSNETPVSLNCSVFFFRFKSSGETHLEAFQSPTGKKKNTPGKMNGWNLNITPLEIRNIIWSKPPLVFSSWWFGWTTHLTNRIVKLDPSSLGFGKIKKEKPPPRYYMILSSPCRDHYGLL